MHMPRLGERCPRNRPVLAESGALVLRLKGLASEACIAAGVHGIPAQHVSLDKSFEITLFENREVIRIATFAFERPCGSREGNMSMTKTTT